MNKIVKKMVKNTLKDMSQGTLDKLIEVSLQIYIETKDTEVLYYLCRMYMSLPHILQRIEDIILDNHIDYKEILMSYELQEGNKE